MRTLAFALLLASAAHAAAQAPSPPGPRYLEAAREELTRMRVRALCEAEGAALARCRFRHIDASAEREHEVEVVLSDSSDTVYLVVRELAVASPEAPATPAVLQRLLELNWRLLGAKLAWSPANGEIRMSALLHTDSNFDRRAFRTVLRMLLAQAERYAPELRRLSAAPENTRDTENARD